MAGRRDVNPRKSDRITEEPLSVAETKVIVGIVEIMQIEIAAALAVVTVPDGRLRDYIHAIRRNQI
jgi:hypothetical protein